jgi:galacturonosyltransferase
MSNVLLESASTGRPVLASNVPGCMETFDEGISGFGFEVKKVDSLVETIIKFIELPHEQKKAMGIAGRKKMEKEFDRNLVIESYLEEIN